MDFLLFVVSRVIVFVRLFSIGVNRCYFHNNIPPEQVIPYYTIYTEIIQDVTEIFIYFESEENVENYIGTNKKIKDKNVSLDGGDLYEK